MKSAENLLSNLITANSLLEAATNEVYEEYKNAGGLKQAELKWLLRKLENSDGSSIGELKWVMEYLLRPKKRTEGKLRMNTNGRYELPGAGEFTCGRGIEVFIDDKDSEDYGWNFGRVEHSSKYGGYYFFNNSGWDHHRLRTRMLVAVRNV